MVDLTIMTKPVNYVVDLDIAKFFDTVDHEKLMDAVAERISDGRVLRLIRTFLRALTFLDLLFT